MVLPLPKKLKPGTTQQLFYIWRSLPTERFNIFTNTKIKPVSLDLNPFEDSNPNPNHYW